MTKSSKMCTCEPTLAATGEHVETCESSMLSKMNAVAMELKEARESLAALEVELGPRMREEEVRIEALRDIASAALREANDLCRVLPDVWSEVVSILGFAGHGKLAIKKQLEAFLAWRNLPLASIARVTDEYIAGRVSNHPRYQEHKARQEAANKASELANAEWWRASGCGSPSDRMRRKFAEARDRVFDLEYKLKETPRRAEEERARALRLAREDEVQRQTAAAIALVFEEFRP
jgi:hypothetical protein